jgi:vsr/mutH/archaeal HJR family nuclease
MKKTEELTKLPNTTMYFPKVELTPDEITRLYTVGHVRPEWLRTVVVNQDDVEAILSQKPKRLSKAKAMEAFVNAHQEHQELWEDIEAYSLGEIDRIDLSVKYGLDYKDLKKVFAACFEQDIEPLWKAHKKSAQKKTSRKLYGTDHPSLNEDVRAKQKQTMLTRYGVEHNMQSKELREEHKQSMLETYGVAYAFELRSQTDAWYTVLFNQLTRDEAWEKVLKHMAETHQYPYSSEMFAPEYANIRRRDFAMSYDATEHIENLLRAYVNVTGTLVAYPTDALFQLPVRNLFSRTWLKHYADKKLIAVEPELYQATSQYERLVMAQLDASNITYKRNDRTVLDGLELDFYLPDFKLGIECNPNQTHNSNVYATDGRRVMFGRTKGKAYHFEKYQKAKDAGITLIQWWEQDLEPTTFLKTTWPRLLARLFGGKQKIGARQITVKPVKNTKQVRAFIDEHHARGNAKAKEYWGFYADSELVAAASFVWKGNEVELKRLCFAPAVQILGGVSKLITNFFRAHPETKAVMTFSDNDLGDGHGYEKAGAKMIGETGPSLRFVSWTDPLDTYSWQIATKWGAKSGVVAKLSSHRAFATQAEIEKYIETEMPHRTDTKCGYDRIYTSGSKKWLFTR